jgi:hypothetical protein
MCSAFCSLFSFGFGRRITPNISSYHQLLYIYPALVPAEVTLNAATSPMLQRYRQAQMTFRTTILILSLAGLLYSCNNTKREDKEFEEQANKNIQLLDTKTLQFLQSWDYSQRGKTTFWSKLSGDSSLFNCSFNLSVDTPKLSTYQVDVFLRYFKSELKVDTTYHKIQFINVGDTMLNLIGTDRYGQDALLSSNLSLYKIFPEPNPFDTLERLTELKEKLNVIGITHNNSFGGFIQFYFPSGQHILTYLPDTLLNSTNLNIFWKTEFLKGKTLKPNWNFRKLEHPIDGG